MSIFYREGAASKRTRERDPADVRGRNDAAVHGALLTSTARVHHSEPHSLNCAWMRFNIENHLFNSVLEM
jgi:hypothetical protein